MLASGAIGGEESWTSKAACDADVVQAASPICRHVQFPQSRSHTLGFELVIELRDPSTIE